jgi:hypothetical protein
LVGWFSVCFFFVVFFFGAGQVESVRLVCLSFFRFFR